MSGYEREVGGAVILLVDLDGLELRVGRRGEACREIENRDVEAWDPGHHAAVRQSGVTAQHEGDVGGSVPAGYCAASLFFSKFATAAPIE